MNAWRLILATVIIFGSGVVLGVVLDYSTHSHAKAAHRPAMASSTTNRPPVVRPIVEVLNLHQPEILSQEFMQKLDDQLEFSPAQRETINKILTDGQDQNHAIWTNCAAQTRQVLQEVRQHVREQLNPDQIKQFEKLLKEMHTPPRKATGTNSMPKLPAHTNAPPMVSTNLAGNGSN